MPLTDVPDRMPWGEAWRLTWVLAADPSSCAGAAMAGWSHPASREWLATVDLFDAYLAAHWPKGRTHQTYPRPWVEVPRALGAGTSMTVEEWRALRASLAEPPARPRDARGRFMKADPTT